MTGSTGDCEPLTVTALPAADPHHGLHPRVAFTGFGGAILLTVGLASVGAGLALLLMSRRWRARPGAL